MTWRDRLPKANPLPVRWEDELVACRVCKVPTGWRTARGRPVHFGCADPVEMFRPITDDELAEAMYALAAELGPFGPAFDPSAEPGFRYRPIYLRHGQCSWCPKPGIGITDDDCLHCARHLWPPWRWPPPPNYQGALR